MYYELVKYPLGIMGVVLLFAYSTTRYCLLLNSAFVFSVYDR